MTPMSSLGRAAAAAVALALALCLVAPSRPSAQIAAPAGDQPLQIQADSGIEWQQNAHLYIARGNAVAIRGDSEVHADTLIAHYRDVKGGGNTNTGGNTEIYRLEAEGHVLLKRNAQTVVGDRAVYDVDTSIAVITGKNLKLTTATDTVTARDSLEWYDQKQIAVGRGNAVAIRDTRSIKADILTAYMVKTAPAPGQAPAPGGKQAGKPAGGATAAAGKPAVTPASAPGQPSSKLPGADAESSKISRVDAQGHVVVSNSIDTGRGKFGVYNAETGIATLIGDVVIERGKDVIRGQRGVMDLKNNVSRMMPGGAPSAGLQRVQGLFVRQDQGGVTAGPTAAGHGAAPPAAKLPPAANVPPATKRP
jgi:lipopolysaccharide export system protein LptA